MARPGHCDRPPACPCNEVTNHTVSALAGGGQGCSLHGHHSPSTLKEEGLRLVTSGPSGVTLWRGLRGHPGCPCHPSWNQPTKAGLVNKRSPTALLAPQGGEGSPMLS